MTEHILLLDTAHVPGAKLGGQLAQCGFRVRTGGDIDVAAGLLREHSPAVVVIHVGSALTLDANHAIRRLSGVPVVVVCAEHDSDLVVRWLEAGADTVLIGPLSRRELGARIRAVLGWHGGSGGPTHPASEQPYESAGLVVDSQTHAVTRDGSNIHLTPTEFRLLAALARRAGEVVSHADLQSEVWGDAHDESLLRIYIRTLRQKLHDDHEQPRLLRCQRGRGYQLAAATAAA